MYYYYAPRPEGSRISGMWIAILLILVCLCATGYTLRSVATADTDEAMHTQVCHAIVSNITDLVGSRLIGQKIAQGAAYGKETLDFLTGKGWSEADIEADYEGIFAQ